MLIMRTTEELADPICELISAKQSLELCDLAFAVDPLGLYGVEPRALGGQQARYSIRTTWLLALTWRLWALIQPLSSWLLCQLALSQINSRASLPTELRVFGSTTQATA